MGLFRNKNSAEYTEKAEAADREAAEHRAAIAKYRKGSGDPAADRAMIEHHEAELRGATRDARIFRDMAK